LKILAIFHLFVGGIGAAGAILIGVSNHNNPLLRMVSISMFIAYAVFFSSGLCIWNHRYRAFSVIVAALACLVFPIGTILGVWTIVALCKREGTRIYNDRSAS
jgi:hypothetical protein